MAPTAISEASVMRLVGVFKTGCESSVALAKASLAAVKAFKGASVHTSSFFHPVAGTSRSLRGFNMAAPWLRNQWLKLIWPRNSHSLRCVLGRGKSCAASTLSSSGRIPLLLKWCPRKVSSLPMNMHFNKLMTMPYSSRC